MFAWYKNQVVNFLCKSVYWFLYNRKILVVNRFINQLQDRLQMLLLILRELISSLPMKLAEKLAITIGFLLIPGGIEIN